MATATVQVVLHTVSQKPEEYVTNTLHFDYNGDNFGLVDIEGKIMAFYNTLANGFFSKVIAQTGHELKFYDAEAPSPKSPIIILPMDFPTLTAGNTLPTEVCLVSSYKAAPVPGIAPGSLRGRIYIGPLGTGANGPLGRPIQSTIDALRDAALALAAVTPESHQVVWSTKLQQKFDIVSGFVDNEFDTQRRRGRESDARSVWALSS